MWTYSQSTGRLAHDSTGIVGTGYSGNGSGLNNGAMEATAGVGPIPRGKWHISPWEDDHPGLGPIVSHLLPNGFDPHGRSGFFIHGDNADMDHTASHGCIVLNKLCRMAMRSSADFDLTVTA